MLTDKRVLITGAGDGIGRAVAIEAARQGAAFVTVSDRALPALEETARLVEEAGCDVAVVTADLRRVDEITDMVATAAREGGGLDTLVNNAGVVESSIGATPTLEDLELEAWDTIYAVNVRAVWLAMRDAAPFLRASTRGPSIVNAGSVAGLPGASASSSPAYSSSKAATIQLTRTGAVALSPDVRVNAYCPGSTDTPMTQSHLAQAEDRDAMMRAMTANHLLPRMAAPEEVAKVVCFLASDDASFMTGAVVAVDAGWSAWRGVRA